MTAERISKRELLVSRICSLTDHEVAEVLEYLNIMETMRTQVDSPTEFEDEVMEMIAPAPTSDSVEALPGARRARRRAVRAATATWSQNYTC